MDRAGIPHGRSNGTTRSIRTLLTADEAASEQAILLRLAPRLVALRDQHQHQIDEFKARLLAERERLVPWFDKLVQFTQTTTVLKVPVFLVANSEENSGGGEANAVYGGGGNVIDFLALAGEATAKAVCAVRDTFREADPAIPRLAFADVLIPMQGPAGSAVRTAERMLAAGVDGVGIHLQYDARRADPALFQGSTLHDVACAVFESVGDRASVQVVGGLSAEQAVALARKGLRAFVISGNLGLPDAKSRYGLPGDEIERHIRDFIDQVSAAG